MRLALEVPTELLGYVQPLSDFDWVLAHLVLEDPNYAEFYKRSTKFKVLDNSVNELLEPVSIKSLAQAAEYIGADKIVAPDYLGDMDKTWSDLMEATRAFGSSRVIPVLQGTEMESIVDGFFKYILREGFLEVAIPYDILSERGSSSVLMAERRLAVTREVISKSPIGLKIHLLGLNTLEELGMHNRGWVSSIDTGVPVYLGLKGYKFGEGTLPDKEAPTMNQMNLHWDEAPDLVLVYYNIAYLRKALGKGY